MALKDIWTNKTDDVDVILADDINAIANEVISNTENKADKADTYTKSEVDNSIEANRLIASQAVNDANAASSLAIQNQTAIEELKKEWVNIFEYEIEDDETYSIELTREAYPELFEAKRVFFVISLPKQTTNPDIKSLYIVNQKNSVIGAFWTTKRELTYGINNGWIVLERFNNVYLTTVMLLQAGAPIISGTSNAINPRSVDDIDNATSMVIKHLSSVYAIPKGLKLTVEVEV